MTRRPPSGDQREGGSSYVGDTALRSSYEPMKPTSGKETVADEPPKPLPGQLKPEAKGRCPEGQVVINGGCWMKAGVEPKKCQGDGFVYVVYKNTCYLPIFTRTREPTSAPMNGPEPE